LSKYRVSADIGGTFTDFVFYNCETGRFKEGKTLSTPGNLSQAIIKGISEELPDFSQIDFFVHGTTSGLNAVLERHGVRVALITTKGFRDVYEIARGNRNELYNMKFRKTTPLIQRKDVFEINERILYNGEVEQEIDPESVLAAVEKIQAGDYEAVAVCLINSYQNPQHELELQKIVEPLLPGKVIALSHKVAREWREYERTSTVVMDAYIAPILKSYLEVLESRMKERGFQETVYIMQSGGGVITADVAKDCPIQTVLSGPVGGAIGNNCLSDMLGYPNLIGVDMGGTSYDVSMVVDGHPDVSTETRLEGFPVLTPMVNIYTIGAGGGSIAWIEGGGLRVGPQSAGASPGPACYGAGGQLPTITDANVVLGRIDPEGFLGGQMLLDQEAACRAVKSIGDQLGLSVEETAEGICKVADAKMADAIRQLTIRKGIDPRRFVLVAYGGAGPMHACLTGEELGIGTILVPEMPGTFSAWGMHQSDIRQDSVRTFTTDVSGADLTALDNLFQEMKEEVSALLRDQNISESQIEYIRTADLRYLGQDHTMNVAFRSGEADREAFRQLRDDFDQLHYSVHGHNNPAEGVELVNIRLTGLGRLERAVKEKSPLGGETPLPPKKYNEVIFHGQRYRTGIYEREKLSPGNRFMGPAIIEELTSTTVVPPDYEVSIDAYRNMLIKKVN